MGPSPSLKAQLFTTETCQKTTTPSYHIYTFEQEKVFHTSSTINKIIELIDFLTLVPISFNYNHRHLMGTSVTACLRFLCHGLTFQTVDGRTLTLKAHMLRHAFATHIHQVQQV